MHIQVVEAKTGVSGIHFEVKPLWCPSDLSFTAPADDMPTLAAPLQEVQSESDAGNTLLKDSHRYIRRLAEEEYMVLNAHRRTWEFKKPSTAIHAIFAQYVAEAPLWWLNKSPSEAPVHHQSVAVARRIADYMVNKMPSDVSFADKLQSAGRHRLYYTDGYFDFERRCFQTHEAADAITTIRVDKPFPQDPGDEAKQEFMERVWDEIFPRGEERDAFLTFTARGLAGLVEVSFSTFGTCL